MGISKNTADGKQNKQDPQQHNKGEWRKAKQKTQRGEQTPQPKRKQAGPAKHNKVTRYLFNFIHITPI